MRRFILALLAATALSGQVRAADDPQQVAGANDTRIRTIDYSEKTVTRLTSTDLVPLTLVFGEGQTPFMIAGLKVVDVTPPDNPAAQKAATPPACTDWCAMRHANELTLQPLKQDFGSMLVVTTKKQDGDQVVYYHYAYELVTRTGIIADAIAPDGKVTTPADPQSYFRVQYTYSAEERAKKLAEWKTAHANDGANHMKQLVSDRLATSKFGTNLNHNWWFNDSPDCRALGPDRVSDDGRQTTIHFRMNAPVSIPNIVDDEGKEHLAQYHTDMAPDSGLLVVVHSVPGRLDPKQPAMVLRRDKQVCGLYNLGYNASGSAPNTGTSSPDVVRQVKP
jgi:type IV secretion system protein VirB9